jgi:23S rRNA (uracil1939-C5)-methyltransferase
VEGDLDEDRSGQSSAVQEQDAPVLQRRVGEYLYTVSPAAFFQANDFMLTELVDTVMKLADGASTRSALELFCGVGLFTLPLARRFENVLGVDSSRLACDLARTNAAAAGFQNVRISCKSVARWMQASEPGSSPAFDLIVLDPPRTGAGPEVMDRIRACAPDTIIYASCDPQTLIRDLASIPARDYRIDYIQGLDLFPQTYHFETIVRLKRHAQKIL